MESNSKSIFRTNIIRRDIAGWVADNIKSCTSKRSNKNIKFKPGYHSYDSLAGDAV